MLPKDMYSGKRMVADEDFEYICEAPCDLLCKVCLTPSVQPLELSPCGHVTCYACCKRLQRKGNADALCPECREPIAAFKTPSRIVVGLLDSLEVRCLSCNAVAQREAYATHECIPKPLFDLALEWGVTQLKKGKFDQACKAFTQGIDKFETIQKPRDQRKKGSIASKLYCGRSRAHFAARQLEQCLRDANSAILCDPEIADGYYLRAIAAMQGDSVSQSASIGIIQDLQKALSNNLESPSDVSDAKCHLAKLRVEPETSASKETALPTSHQDPTATLQEIPCNPPTQRDEHAIQNSIALLRECWNAIGEDTVRSYEALSPQQREGLLREVEPCILPRPGATMDGGEDLHVVAYLAPELNITGLCRASGGLRDIIHFFINGNYSSIVFDSVLVIVDALSTPANKLRQEFLASHGTDPKKVIVDSRSGEICDTKVTARSQKEFDRLVADAERKRSERQWVPLYVRRLALDRLSLMVDFVLRVLLAAAKRCDVSTKPYANVFGCLQCGKKLIASCATCESCKLAQYCSSSCRALHKTNGHQRGCSMTVDLSSTFRTVYENLERSMPPELSDKQSLNLYHKYCNEQKCHDDLFGDGDQTPLAPARKVTDDSQKLRTMWASGLDFNPRANRNTELFTACYDGSPDVVRKILAECPNPEMKRKLVNYRETLMRFSPLHSCIAGARGKNIFGGEFIEIAKMLIAAGSNVNAKDFCGFSCVHLCSTAYASDESLEILLLLGAAGANANAVNRLDETAILEPVNAQKIDAVKTLMMIGADPHLLACGGSISAMTLTMMIPAVRQILAKCAPLVGLKAGATVVLDGLVSKPHLNGRTATVIELKVGKYQLQLEGTDDQIICKMENLRLPTVNGDPSTCKKCKGGPVAALKRCSRCKTVWYCSPECQRSDWADHKPNCTVQSSIVVQRVASSADNNTHGLAMVDLTERRKASDRLKPAPKAGSSFIVKVQVPLEMATMMAKFGGNIVIYNENHSIDWNVSQSHMGVESYSRLFQLVQGSGVNGLKIYLKATLEVDGALHLSTQACNIQPW